MADTTNLRVTELDFDQIKSNLKDFLKSQEEFTDYNFEGSALAVLLDLLSYNTHYNAIYANLIANEMFLDSATKRASVVSLAKHFGYTPRSVVSPRAKVRLSITTSGNPQTLLLQKWTPFTTTIDGTTFTFYNLSNVVTTPTTANNFTFNEIELVEGVPLTYRWPVTAGVSAFVIPNSEIDVSTLTVEVQTSATDATMTTYNYATDMVGVSSTDPVYFLEETREGLYKIVFGDGTIGKSLVDGNIVSISYLSSNGQAANGATSFNMSSVGGFTVTNYNMALLQAAAGGKPRESVDSIRYNASKFFVTQNRAVTSEDYKNIILAEYPEITAISAWGGDVNDPPIYGKVFISAKPSNGMTLSTEVKNNLSTILNKKNVVGITPEFIDPELLYLTVDTTFYYDPSKTVSQTSTLEANVRGTIRQYRYSELDNFDSIFRKSKLSRLVDYTDKSILNNNTEVKMFKLLAINTELQVNYNINFINPVTNISSTAFRMVNDSKDYFFEDDGVGNLRRYYISNTQKVIADPVFGKVDYKTGKLSIPTVALSMLTQNCRIYATPTNQDINSVRNQIITILDTDITVTGKIDTRKPLVR